MDAGPRSASRGQAVLRGCPWHYHVVVLAGPKHGAAALIPRREDLTRFEFVSFDVFDTTLSRSVLHPTGVFDVMSREVEPLLRGVRGKVGFPRARIIGESLARRTTRCEEVTLEEIYSSLGMLLGLSRGLREELMRIELRTEVELSVPVRPVIELARELRAAGQRVRFISDCYLPDDFVRHLLLNAGVEVEQDEVYVSSRFRATKASGSLFRVVASREGLRPEGWCHFGDNPHSDVSSPRRLGIQAEALGADGKVPREEARICPRATRARGRLANPVSELLAAPLRAARVWSSGSADADENLGFHVVGPLFLPFVCWVLRESLRRDARRVFFLARDGQILHNLASVVTSSVETGLDLRYLFVSRQSLNLPTLGLQGVSDEWIFESNEGLNVERLARRLHVEPEVVRENLATMGIVESTPDGSLTTSQQRTLRERFVGSSLRSMALRKAEAARSSSLGYLGQEGLFEHARATLVDLGWRGTLQDRLTMLARARSDATLFEGLYFGLLNPPERHREGKVGFLFDRNRLGWSTLAGVQSIALFELLTQASHGTTLSYRIVEGRFEPVLAKGEDVSTAARIQAGACRYVRSVSPSALRRVLTADDGDLRSACRRIAVDIFFRPTTHLANHVGAMSFSGEQGEIGSAPIAPPLRGSAALRAIVSGRPFHPARRTFWLPGSLVRGRSVFASVAGFVLRQTTVIVLAAYGRVAGPLFKAIGAFRRGRNRSPDPA